LHDYHVIEMYFVIVVSKCFDWECRVSISYVDTDCSVIYFLKVKLAFVGLLQAKQNYERELQLHATDVESLTQVKQEVSSNISLCLCHT